MHGKCQEKNRGKKKVKKKNHAEERSNCDLHLIYKIYECLLVERLQLKPCFCFKLQLVSRARANRYFTKTT